MFLQKELHFDDELVLQQIKHTGILQIVHIQKSGYSAKYSFKVGSRVVKRMCWVFLVYVELFSLNCIILIQYIILYFEYQIHGSAYTTMYLVFKEV